MSPSFFLIRAVDSEAMFLECDSGGRRESFGLRGLVLEDLDGNGVRMEDGIGFRQ